MTVQCHYCTHYSSAIIVASYLVRMPPYTQAFCSLQVSSLTHTHNTHHYFTDEWLVLDEAGVSLLEIQSQPVIPGCWLWDPGHSSWDRLPILTDLR